MEELFSQLGLDWKLIIAQIVNFAILAYVLYRFLYRPLIAAVEKRKQDADDTAAKTKEIEKRLLSAEKERESILAEARKESEQLIKTSEVDAKRLHESLLAASQQKAVELVSEAEKRMRAEKEKMLQDIKKEVGTLIAVALEKTLGAGLDENVEAKLRKEALEKIS